MDEEQHHGTRNTAHLRELSKVWVAEERCMTKQLMTDVWFGGVVGLGAMADVLGGVEHSEGQTSEKITRREETCRDNKTDKTGSHFGLSLVDPTTSIPPFCAPCYSMYSVVVTLSHSLHFTATTLCQFSIVSV